MDRHFVLFVLKPRDLGKSSLPDERFYRREKIVMIIIGPRPNCRARKT
jgi:hypothetical protein